MRADLSTRIRLEARLKRIAFSASSRASRSRLTLLPSFLTGRPVTSMVCGPSRRHRLLNSHLEIDILGLIAGSIGVGDIGRHQLLPGAQQIHVSFQAL